MMHTHKGLDDTPEVTRTHRTSWKNGLEAVFGAARRLHRYRDVHTAMMRDALCSIECAKRNDCCHDE